MNARRRLAGSISLGLLVVAAASASCAHGPDRIAGIADNPDGDTTLAVPAEMSAFYVATYDGSGEAVHPDYAAPLNPWSHKPRYLAMTPYPNGNFNLENPVLYSGNNG